MALSFSGTGQYLSLATTVPNVPVTMALWHKAVAFSGVYIAWGTSGSGNQRLTLQNDGNDPAAIQASTRQTSAGTTETVATAGTVASGAWHHAAAVFASATSRTAYLNGTASSTGTTNLAVTTGDLLRLMANPSAASLSTGSTAEAAVWSAALTADEIAALAKGASPLKIRRASLWGYWRLNVGDSPAPDLSGNARPMTWTGSPTRADHAPVSFGITRC